MDNDDDLLKTQLFSGQRRLPWNHETYASDSYFEDNHTYGY